MLLNRRLHPAIQSACPSREPFIQLREGEAIMRVNRLEHEHNIIHTCSLARLSDLAESGVLTIYLGLPEPQF